MPNYITILSEDLANKIAAGEVIERPAAVVKELIENALDAGATSLEVSIEGAGIKSIRVADNGRGMSRDDALTCLERHATSKIRTVEDLIAIHTLGFRGEALPSIASVSRMEILTRQSEDLAGTWVTINGGRLKDVKEQGAPVGTTIAVRQLFYNTPARRKFLKTPETEFRHITRVIMLAALGYPHVAFRLLHNDHEYFSLPVAASLIERIAAVFGPQTIEQLLSIHGHLPTIEISGFIGRPSLSRKSREDQLTFVNGRPFFNAMVSYAIKEGYANAMMVGRFPFTILFLKLDPRMVDVNVHPTKREVRFGQERLVRDFLTARIRETLLLPPVSRDEQTDDRVPADFSPAPGAAPAQSRRTSFFTENRGEQRFKSGLWDRYQEFRGGSEQPKLPLRAGTPDASDLSPNEPDPLTLANKIETPAPDEVAQFRQAAILLQIQDCYIIAPVKNGFWVIDQHAAHERIVFEHAKKTLKDSVNTSQQLLFPLTLELTPPEASTVREYQPVLEKLGFSIKFFGATTIIIEAVPITLKSAQEEPIFRDIIDDLSHFETTKIDLEDHIIATYACHTSVRAGQRLSQAEMTALIDALFATPQPFVCPHGRPVILRFTVDELEKRFGRH